VSKFEIEQRIRIEVSRLEHLTERARMDMSRGGEWRCDYDGWRKETEKQLEWLFDQLRSCE
jgi:hypothetical protein